MRRRPYLWEAQDDRPWKERTSWKLWLVWHTARYFLKGLWVFVSIPFQVIFSKETWREYRASKRRADGSRIPSTCLNLDCTPAWVVGGDASTCIRCGREANCGSHAERQLYSETRLPRVP